jgi:hypothetical protein
MIGGRVRVNARVGSRDQCPEKEFPDMLTSPTQACARFGATSRSSSNGHPLCPRCLSLLIGVLVNEDPSQIQTGAASGKFRLCPILQADLNFMRASIAPAGGRAYKQTVRYS